MKKQNVLKSSGPAWYKLICLLAAVCIITTNCQKDDAPIAAFTSSLTNITPGQAVEFTDQSINNPTGWSWDFGDGGTSTLQNPTHTYLVLGTYAVNLTVTNEGGSDTKNQSDYVRVSYLMFNPDLTYGSLSDIDGNKYRTIQIGSQTWMAENLKTTRYNDGTALPLVVDNSTWINTTSSPKYCWPYNNELVYKEEYGALYNWFVVSPTSNEGKNICPIGWHVPSDDEWIILMDYLGGRSIAGGKLKESGLTHWASPNLGATNHSGFTGISTTKRFHDSGNFSEHTNGFANWWTTTPYGTGWGFRTMGLYYNSREASGYVSYPEAGHFIRCVKD